MYSRTPSLPEAHRLDLVVPLPLCAMVPGDQDLPVSTCGLESVTALQEVWS